MVTERVAVDATSAGNSIFRKLSLRARLRKPGAYRSLVGGVIGWLLLVGLWYWASASLVEPAILLPSPTVVAEDIWDLVFHGDAIYNFGVTLESMAVGFAISGVIGGVIGVLAGRNRYWYAFFHSPVLLIGNTPTIAYAVLALLLFGIGSIGPIFAIVVAVTPYVAVEIMVGAREVDWNLLQMSRAYGRTRLQRVRSVVIPSLMPFAFTAARASFAVSWKVATLTELFGGSAGVGVEVRDAYESFEIAQVMAWLILFVLFMMLFELVIFARLERYIFRWRGSKT